MLQPEKKIPFLHQLPLTRIKLLVARILYFFIKIFIRKDHRHIHRHGLTFAIDLSEGIDLALFIFGSFQRHIIRRVGGFISEDSVILDIGANIGAMTLPFAQLAPKGHVFAFEPTVVAYTKLSRNISLNPQCAKRITPVNRLVAEKTGAFPPPDVYSSWKISGAHPTRHPLHGGLKQSVAPETTISIDDFCLENGISKVELIKIDTEGDELKVLKGSYRTIKACRPYVVFEISLYLFKKNKLSFDDYGDFFSRLNYRLINSKNGQVITKHNFHRHIPIRYMSDIIAIPC